MKLKPNMHPKSKKTRLTYDLIPDDVKAIADESIGPGALQAIWRTHSSANGECPFNLMWKIVDGVSVGFALYHYESITNGAFSYRVGIIDMLCVSPTYRKMSYGAVITFHVLKAMSTVGVNRIEMIMREPHTGQYDDYPNMQGLGSERFLYDLGFRKVAYFPTFWKHQSQRYTYTCNICNASPDECTGVLMAMNED